MQTNKEKMIYEDKFNINKKSNNNSFADYIKTIITVLLFIATLYIIRLDLEIVFNHFTIDNSSIRGILVNFQLLLSIILVLVTINKGYIIAYILNIYSITMVLINIFIMNNYWALPGFTSYIIALIIITILYFYRSRLLSQLETLLEQRKKLKHLVYHDNLTNIANRKKIIEQLNELIMKSKENDSNFSLVFIDLNDFKNINDSLGHYVGDYILKKLVNRITSNMHQDDILGRFGGDEFALIIRRDLNKDEIIEYINRLKSLLLNDFTFKNRSIKLSASFGIAIYPSDGQTTNELFKSADIAMYKAKNNSTKSIAFNSRSLEKGFIHNIKIENGLQNAITNDELYLVFQAQYTAEEQSLRGFEALLRWDSSELGNVSPAQFIPIAEDIGLINEIGDWVLINAITTFKKISESCDIKAILSINISVAQLIRNDFVQIVSDILEETNFDSKYLEFEITESIFISYPEDVKKVICQLKQRGISIAFDDFGTGYSSLSILQELSMDVLKIDKIFIDRINTSENKKNIIGPIIKMAHQLELEVIAEGVETQDELDYLKEKNCDFIQGYLLAKPVDKTQLEDIMQKSKNKE